MAEEEKTPLHELTRCGTVWWWGGGVVEQKEEAWKAEACRTQKAVNDLGSRKR